MTTLTQRPAIHFKKGERVAFKNDPKARLFKVDNVKLSDAEEHENLPIRLTVEIPSLIEGEKPTSAVVGFRHGEQAFMPAVQKESK